MGRIFKDCFEMIREMDRELKVSGITVPVNHYQNQELSGGRPAHQGTHRGELRHLKAVSRQTRDARLHVQG